jgi:ABC-type multidrug transport system fused ATPase/permease subunit
VEVLNEMFANVLVNMLRDIFVIAGIVGVLFYLDWRLALVALASLPFVIGASFYFRILARQAFRLVRQKVGAINAFLQENISGIQVIKLFNRQMENQGSFAVLNEEYYGARLKELFVFSVFGPLINVLSAVSIGLIVWYGGLLTLENTLTLGKLIVFISYVQRFFHPIRDMSEKYNMLQAAMASSERIFQILDEPEEIRDPDVPVTLDDMKGKIEFRNVWFAYKKEDWVLRDISFTVEPGRSLALVGATGAGKTSIISLLGRFYEVNQGQILIDDVDIRQFKQSYLRSLLGVVMQDVFIFSGDFRDNIRLKNKNITDEEVCRAAECVMASGFIERYPDKYVEEVHERGSTLSAGERQLLAFARALAFDTRILVLDEATANIDTETEEKIQKAIAAMMKGRSTIVIAHRLSTVQNMDRIAVMHNGEITEMGTHDELMGQDGIYRNLIEIQALESKEP